MKDPAGALEHRRAVTDGVESTSAHNPNEPTMIILAAVVAVLVVVGLLARRRSGRFTLEPDAPTRWWQQ